MKRIISACLEQTIRFDTYNDANPQEDFEKFIQVMDRKKAKYQVVDQWKDEKGVLFVKLKKQYNAYSTEGYIE